MSEPTHQLPVDWNDWLNVDLLDACYDPMHDGMGLDSQPTSHACSNLPEQPPQSQPQARIEANSKLQQQYPIPHQAPESESGYIVPAGQNAIDPWRDTTMATEGTSAPPTKCPESLTKKHHICLGCNELFEYSWDLTSHAKNLGHLSFQCRVAGCEQLFVSLEERDAHERRPHTTGHGRVATSTPFDCIQCKASFKAKSALLLHAKEQQHQPYACECGALFSRLDVLNRHLESVGTDDPAYPCRYCRLHRGANGFRRKDHLMQHVRNYHHHEVSANIDDDGTAGSNSRLKYSFPVCSHPECPKYRTEAFKTLHRSTQEKDKPFASQSAYTKHMREEHNECTFPCDIPGCTRVGRRGYFREKDLIKHRSQEHPDAPEYRVSTRELLHKCMEPGCEKSFDLSSLKGHYASHDYRRWRLEHKDKEDKGDLTALPSWLVLYDASRSAASYEEEAVQGLPELATNTIQDSEDLFWGMEGGI